MVIDSVRPTRNHPQLVWCVALLVGGALADLYGPEPYMGLPLLAAAPIVAGALLTFRLALCLLVVACLLSLGLDVYLGREMVALIINAADIAIVGVVALAINVMLYRQRRQLVRTLDVAEAAQRAILPDLPDTVGPLRIAACYEAAMAEARIGGDLYAVQDTPFGVRALIGDVRGKGLQAVGTVSVAIGAFRQEAEHVPSLVELAQRLDDALSRESERRAALTDSEEFTTAVLVEFSADGATVRLVNLGHPAPCLVHDGAVTRLDPGDRRLPLGMQLPGMGQGAVSSVDTVRLPPGAFLLLITDGVVEARDSRGVFYDPVSGVLAHRTFKNPHELVQALVDDVKRWTGGGQQDDMAAVVFAHGHPAAHHTPLPRL
ncbi:PP2C family protein-serine/threonine phosphatase [Streptomyces odontomachi]|uniref:PP2C family protein-serine/threonine phosphatase n=1 Tax=Streptomyces odontomachi TaxID=2944940 RepID=UPI00210F0C59|nr:PP2C family protein-serine/threonine phosphatase [Streptomyces sp. ODS25]